MESFPVRVSAIDHLFSEPSFDAQSRYWQPSTNQPMFHGEVICPRPCRRPRAGASYALDSSNNRFLSKHKSSFLHRGEFGLDHHLDTIWSEITEEADDDHMVFFTGSPPIRASNPMTRDVSFAKLPVGSQLSSGALSSPKLQLPTRPLTDRRAAAIGSPTTCGTSSLAASAKPKVRIEGFACVSSANPSPRCVAATTTMA